MRTTIFNKKRRIHGSVIKAFFSGIILTGLVIFISFAFQKKAHAQLVPIGLYNLQIVWTTSQADNSPMEVIMNCPAGKVAIGGGVDDEDLLGMSIEASRPYGPAITGATGSATVTTGWYVRVNPGRNAPNISSYAVCVSQGT